ncbi:hypothetical protein LRY65_00685 [Candidatus Woesebacteria bacterium]|nr:hypothetical protein [Candidatus Woesebacteria bacterium]MCD8526715.1 hypothetical protein [Candidatus Woesebacteria bacterium]MCD8546541.1 hypothetical protein [Candidatus Woesebacteria bacterium]
MAKADTEIKIIDFEKGKVKALARRIMVFIRDRHTFGRQTSGYDIIIKFGSSHTLADINTALQLLKKDNTGFRYQLTEERVTGYYVLVPQKRHSAIR